MWGKVAFGSVQCQDFNDLRDLDPIQNALHDLICRYLVSLGLVGQHEAMTQAVWGYSLDVFRSHVRSSGKQCVALRGEREKERRAWARTVTHERTDLLVVRASGPCRFDDADDVVPYAIVDVDAKSSVAEGSKCGRPEHRLDGYGGRISSFSSDFRANRKESVEHLTFRLAARVIDQDLEHEPIDLRLRQRVRPLVIYGILSRKHEERIREPVRCVADRDLPFLHGFEKGALYLGGRSIDLIRKENVCEHGTTPNDELAGRTLVHKRPDEIRGQEIGRELDARKRHTNGFGECSGGKSLCEAGHTLEQHMSASQEADEQPLDESFLTDDPFADLSTEPKDGGKRRLDLTSDGLNVRLHEPSIPTRHAVWDRPPRLELEECFDGTELGYERHELVTRERLSVHGVLASVDRVA